VFLKGFCGCLSDSADKKPVLLHSNPLLAHIANRGRKMIHYIIFDIHMTAQAYSLALSLTSKLRVNIRKNAG
jgi:hypothetical protein